MTIRLYVNAAGFAAPGIECLHDLYAALRGGDLALPDPVGWQPSPDCLPRRTAMRLSGATRLAIHAAAQIGETLPPDASWVFASSSGEGEILHQILNALCELEILVQPLRFQNAVHNAAQGQWSIAAKATGPMTSVAAFDDTVGAGLLKAAMQATTEACAVGLVMFDAPLPVPLHEKRPFLLPMAAALSLAPLPGPRSIAAIDLALADDPPASTLSTTETIRAFAECGNPIRFALPILDAIRCTTLGAESSDGMGGGPCRVVLGLPGKGRLTITVRGNRDA